MFENQDETLKEKLCKLRLKYNKTTIILEMLGLVTPLIILLYIIYKSAT